MTAVKQVWPEVRIDKGHFQWRRRDDAAGMDSMPVVTLIAMLAKPQPLGKVFGRWAPGAMATAISLSLKHVADPLGPISHRPAGSGWYWRLGHDLVPGVGFRDFTVTASGDARLPSDSNYVEAATPR